MPSKVKIVNGSEHVLEVEEAARRLKGLGLKVSRIETLSVPFEIGYPFHAGARSSDSAMILEVRGKYCDLLKLAGEVN
jgi:hypothetical protein